VRTTLDIDDAVLAAARAIAEAENRSLVPADAPAITPDMVDRALDE
jgi:2-phospho-L-lactate guanylyltransferase (CobY/MobA/RfbA family)